ncbi:MAG TPA: flagellar motor switch protein FliN [Candidatus Binatia bacterium]|jgi:flagellar motor switch protein FliN/FliY|nr:flagellar motor switch protein FliN [Candidatus Binatia bacterium]
MADEGATETAAGTEATAAEAPRNFDLLLDIPLEITVEIGRTRLAIRDLLALGAGSVVELTKLAGEPLDVLINGKPVARGEAVMVNDKFGVRLTEIASPSERIAGLK